MLTGEYRQTYNRIRPHSSLGCKPPAAVTPCLLSLALGS